MVGGAQGVSESVMRVHNVVRAGRGGQERAAALFESQIRGDWTDNRSVLTWILSEGWIGGWGARCVQTGQLAQMEVG